jgi:D-alanyl-D-alanine carboxypeptidase
VADKDSGEALTPQHRFRIASISKPITSTGIFTLIEAGKLQLDSRVFGPNSILGDITRGRSMGLKHELQLSIF